MAYSSTSTIGTGQPQQLAVPPYLDKSHLTITIDGVPTADFTWTNDSTISGTAGVGKVVKVQRRTSPQARLVDYISGLPLTENTLDMDSLQSFYLFQEIADGNAPPYYPVGPALITSDVTVNVPGQFATIALAMTYLRGFSITQGAKATIKVADGTYVLTATTNLNHPNGGQIRLIGNQTNPSLCILLATTAGFDGLTVTDGNVFGFIDGFKLKKTAKAPFADNSVALLAKSGATVVCGESIAVDNWYYGIAAMFGSHITAPKAVVTNAGDVGIWAFVGSTVEAPNATSNNAGDAENGWGWGFEAEYGSAMNVSGGKASGCRVGGIGSLSNSNIRALSAIASGNIGSGFFARDGGTIECHNGTASNNGRYGVEEIGSSRVLGNTLTLTGNTIGPVKNIVYLDNENVGARLAANGPLRIDNNAQDPTYFNTSGGCQLEIAHTPNATNHWRFTGGGNNAGLSLDPVGTDLNIAANINAKGTEVVRLLSNGRTAFQSFNGSPSVANFLQVTGSNAGSGPSLTAQGSDAVIDLGIFPKGAGSYIQLGVGYTSTGDTTCNGYIVIKDSGGVVRKLMTTA